MKRRTCNECQFWFPIRKDEKSEGGILLPHPTRGECRIKSPVVFSGACFEASAAWPSTLAGHWCGEFKLLPELISCHKCGNPVGENPVSFFSHTTFGPYCSEKCMKAAQDDLNAYLIKKDQAPIQFT